MQFRLAPSFPPIHLLYLSTTLVKIKVIIMHQIVVTSKMACALKLKIMPTKMPTTIPSRPLEHYAGNSMNLTLYQRRLAPKANALDRLWS